MTKSTNMLLKFSLFIGVFLSAQTILLSLFAITLTMGVVVPGVSTARDVWYATSLSLVMTLSFGLPGLWNRLRPANW